MNPAIPVTSHRHARPFTRRPVRWISTTLASHLVAGGLAVVALSGPLASPAAAPISTTLPSQRLCSTQPVSVVLPAQTLIEYKLFVPASIAVPITVSVAVQGELSFTIDAGPENWSTHHSLFVDTISGSRTINTSYPAQSTSGEVSIRIGNQNGNTATVTSIANAGNPARVCAPLSPKETTGNNCAVKHANDVQRPVADPVNTATGNFNMPFDDISIPGRGPGIDLNHAYNSLQAVNDGTGPPVDGPLGVGWTFSYGAHLSLAPAPAPPGAIAVHQESGAELIMYPAANNPDNTPAWEAPPRAVASLKRIAGNPVTYEFKRCNTTTMVFSAPDASNVGRLLSVADRNGYPTTLQYDASGKLSTVTDAAGRKLHVYWNGAHITAVGDRPLPNDAARKVTFGYNDAGGNLTDYTDVAKGAWHFTYDGHLLRTMRRPNQAGASPPKVTENFYDTRGRVTKQIDEKQRITDIRFDDTANPRTTTVTDPELNVTVETYVNFVRTSITRGSGTPDEATWRFETDPYTLGITKVIDPNNPANATSANNHTTQATYDRNGNMTSYTDALEHTATAIYNEFDQPRTITAPISATKNLTTTYSYDARGNLTKVSRPLTGTVNQATEYFYDPLRPGDLTSVKDPNQQVWKRTNDATFGYPQDTTDPLEKVTLYGYDTATGWLTTMVSPKGKAAGVTLSCMPPAEGCTKFVHDAWGRVTLTTDGNGHQTTSAYDKNGNLDDVTDGEGNFTNYIYDDANQLERVDRPGPTDTETTYWKDGRVRETFDGADKKTAYAYDHQGRLRTVTDPKNRVTIYGYDPAGNLVSKADPGGTCPATPWTGTLALTPANQCTVMRYDDADRLSSVTYSDGATPNVSYTYYDNGERKSMTDGIGTSSWEYDDLRRLTYSRDSAGREVRYGYLLPDGVTHNLRDPANTITYAPNQVLKRAFDKAGRMTSVTDWLTPANTTSFHPDADSNVDEITFPAASGLVDTYSFDKAGQLSTITNASSGATRSSLTYVRDKNDQVKTVSSTGAPAENHSYTYSPLNQLEGVDGTAYAYDSADNLKTLLSGKTQAFDDANQLCWTGTGTTTCDIPPPGATTYQHDSRGNRTRKVEPTGATTAYDWDQANRLTKVAAVGSQGQYTALTPARILDTRAATRTGVCPGGTCTTLAPGQAKTLKVAGQGGVPATGAAAVALSVVVTQPSSSGWLTVWPSNVNWPGTSNLNWSANQTVSNLVVVKLAPDGTVNLFNFAGTAEVVIDVSGWYAASDGGAGSGFNAINASRILDTRIPQGSCPGTGCGAIGTDSVLKLQVAGQGGVPASGVAAVAVNLTVTNVTAPSYLTVWPSDQPRPAASSMTITPGQNTAELVMAKVAADGTISIYNPNGRTDVIADVSGWFATGSGSTFQPLTPARILDTRPGVNAGSCVGTCQTIPSGGALTVNVAGQGGVPVKGANAVAVNVTVVNGPNYGFLTLWPTDAARPNAAQLNYAPGQTVANSAIVKMAADGTVSIYALAGPVDILMDVHGYYTQPVPTTTYAYNGDGLRMSKTVAGTTTSFTWTGGGAIPLLLSDGTNSYIYGPDGLPVEHIANGVPTWYHHDQLGSTRSLTNAAGAVVSTVTHDPYGNRTALTGTLTPLGFAGEYTDAETGFVYLRARYHDPATGQFLSRDPLVALTGSAYGYVDGNPLNGKDPTGLKPWWHRVTATLNAGATLLAVGATVADALPIAGSRVGSYLGAASFALSAASAGVQCGLGGFDPACKAAIAVAALSGATVLLSYVAGQRITRDDISRLTRVGLRGIQYIADVTGLLAGGMTTNYEDLAASNLQLISATEDVSC